MVFTAHDTGPWYLTPEQRERQRHDRSTGKSSRFKRSKKQLTEALLGLGINFRRSNGSTREQNCKILQIGTTLTSMKTGQKSSRVGWDNPKVFSRCFEKTGLCLKNC